MIFDSFTFYNEKYLLTYRLNLLSDIVDFFVIVESTHTHTAKSKILFFNEIKHRFENFSEKIIHIIVDDFPYTNPLGLSIDQVWCNE